MLKKSITLSFVFQMYSTYLFIMGTLELMVIIGATVPRICGGDWMCARRLGNYILGENLEDRFSFMLRIRF